MANRKREHDYIRVLGYIIDYKKHNDGASPSIREIGAACSITSTSVVRYILMSLEKEGHIRLAEGSRGIVVSGGRWVYDPILSAAERPGA